ncbi:hypothetical protein ASG90_18680 [Nocardioides sp. Soil797]|nr:hypothetical protein ASG90_18680 [Nocardioides sp. Soil797]
MNTHTSPSFVAARMALTDEFAGVFSRQTVEQCFDDSRERLPAATIERFLPLLAQRFARERLRAAARALPEFEAAARLRPLVLFVCTANSGRSQMAAALLSQRSAGSVDVVSAGTHPGDQVQAEVRTVMNELDIDVADAFPKPLTDEVVSGADVVITMGCGDSCPILPGRRYLDWEVADPAEVGVDVVRQIRDDIDAHVTALLVDLDMVPATNASGAL